MTDPKKKIYRIVNFFDLFNILNSNKLRITKQSVFDDQNEGLGHVLNLQTSIYTRHSYRSIDELINAHKKSLYSTYVSCWTLKQDSIALWTLYSNDQSSIRIRTSVLKLRKCLKVFNDEKGIGNYSGPLDGKELIAQYTELGEAKYVDFFKLRNELRDKFSEFDNSLSTKGNNDSGYFNSKEFYDDFYRFNESIMHSDSTFLKDEAYSHEEEIRGVIHCGVRSGRSIEEVREDPMKSLIYSVDDDVLPDHIHVSVESDFIEEICFDPRLPAYKLDVFKSILSQYELNITTSNAFGYALEQGEFVIDIDV
jgi:hypothetical protein